MNFLKKKSSKSEKSATGSDAGSVSEGIASPKPGGTSSKMVSDTRSVDHQQEGVGVAANPAYQLDNGDDMYEYKDGDYQLRIHIVECLELLPISGSCIVDPVVFIDVCGRKVHTKQKKQCNSCIFDEYFYIQLDNMNRSKIEDGTIAISVLDCSSRLTSMMSKNVIGAFNTDLETVYQSPAHELYRQWIPLFSASRAGLTGKMMLTLELLGPGDKPQVHDRKAEILLEKKQRKKEGAVISPSLSAMPQFAQRQCFLVVEIFKAEGIPVLDKSMFTGKVYSHISAYVNVEFDRHEKVHTESAKLSRGSLNDADYMTALWLPYMDPCFSNRIQLRVVEHHSISSDDVLASAVSPALHLRLVKQGMEGKLHTEGGSSTDPTQLFWVNLYGAPVPEVAMGGEARKDDMNMYPDTASAYRGRLLVRLRIDDNKPSKKGKKKGPEVLKVSITEEYLRASHSDTDMSSLGSWFSVSPASTKGDFNESHKASSGQGIHVSSAPPLPVLHSAGGCADAVTLKAGMNPVLKLPSDLLGLPMPKTSRYVLKAMVYAGQSFPQGAFLKSKRFSVELRLMHRRLLTPVARMEDNYIMWPEPVLLKEVFDLPDDPAMMPDLFMYILNKELEPLCYKRFPLVDFLNKEESEQFSAKPDWVIPKIDKTISSTPHDIFPGAVLMKIGLGKEAVANKSVWKANISTQCTTCQVNLHVYQGRGLPPSDSTGLLDPYVLVRVGTSIIKTKVHKKTRDPQFMETLSFHMKLPVDDNLKPQLFLEIFDEDLSGDDFVGLVKLDLALADKRAIPEKNAALRAKLRDPEWFSLRSKIGADLMGQLLVGYEVISLESAAQAASYFTNEQKLIPSPSLAPECLPWKLEMTVLGLRDLEPAGMIPVCKPYVTIGLNGIELRKLPPSKKPTPTDPNYLCRFQERVMLPERVLYAPCINIGAKDRKLGVMTSTIIGSVSIPLDDKMVLPSSNTCAGKRQSSSFRSGNPYISQEVLINSQIRANDSTQSRAEDACRWEDGLEAGDRHANYPEELLASALQATRAVNKNDLADYLVDRLMLDCELESALSAPPFERYALTTGSVASGAENAFDTSFCQVGVLKCNVTLTQEAEETLSPSTASRSQKVSTSLPLAEMKLEVETVVIRLYVLQGYSLAGKDDDNLSDPYLVVKFGEQEISTRERHKRNTRNPKFFECFEFTSKLPGVNDILISVKDHNDIYSDDLIGATVIDLEDRWFCEDWKRLNKILSPSADFTGEPRAPLEKRALWNPESSAPQGTLSMWLDILPASEAKKFPAKVVTPPPAEDWEVRVIVWSATDVPCGDPFEDMNDLYIKCSLGGDRYLSTDTHLRLPTGQKGSFNWRMKFPVALPVSEFAEGGTRLFVQAWDMDFITSSDCLGSTQIDLSDSFDKALRKRARRIKMGRGTHFVHQHFFDNKAADGTKGHVKATGWAWYFGQCWSTVFCCCPRAARTPSAPTNDAVGAPPRGGADDEGSNLDDIDLEAGMQGRTERTPLITATGATSAKRSYTEVNATSKTRIIDGVGLIRDADYDNNDESDGDEEGIGAAESQSLQPAGAGRNTSADIERATKATEVETSKKSRRKKPISLYGQAAQSLGFAAAKIEHAAEVQLFTSDQQPAGKVLMSIEILHRSVADVVPAGEGRSEPNTNPTLPDPEGRIDFSKMWNPFYLCRVCAGDKIFAELACVFSCLLFCVIYYFIGQPILTLFMVLKEFFGMQVVGIILLCLVVGCCAGCFYVRAKVRAVCCAGDEDED